MKYRILLILLLLALAIAFPAAAQDDDTLIVSTGGIMLTIDKDFATGVAINPLPADPPEYGPGFAEPASTQISFINPPPGFAAESILTIRIYRTDDFADYPMHIERLSQLQILLDNDSPLTEFMQPAPTMPGVSPLPFIPLYLHGTVLQARAEYVQTPLLQGIRYITAIAAAIEPLNSRSFIYTWQGVTNDGEYYVSAQAFLTTSLFEDNVPVEDPAAFADAFPDYLTGAVATLNAAAPTDFTPSLADIDAIMESLTVTPIV
ncbi:MAG: hypothetical protein SF123_24935 [Chloroflexota bacterium]|nr:hypothetical protein [Chloroflexota bacterium]